MSTDFADACPIATVAGEVASTNEVLRRATADMFESWLAAVAEDAIEARTDPARVRALALAVLSLLEGAFPLSRATRSTEPMSSCSDAAVALVRAALSETMTSEVDDG